MTRTLVVPFPEPGERMKHAYHDLFRAETAEKPAQVADLGPLDVLPRPWDPASATDGLLRVEIWEWLDQVVAWINREYVWETGDLIPHCWPQHPHLVHELGVVADQRRRAGMAFTSDNLEDWHRYCLPAFLDRMKTRYRGFCEEGHENAPGTARLIRYESTNASVERNDLYANDITALLQTTSPPTDRATGAPAESTRRFQLINGTLVDAETGELAHQLEK